MALYDPSEMAKMVREGGMGLDKRNEFKQYTHAWRERNVDILIDLLKNYTRTESFDMETWVRVGGGYMGVSPSEAQSLAENDCGTSACAGGHAAIAGIGYPEQHASWGTYLTQTFGDKYMICWSAHWGGSPLDAAKRIEFVKNGGIIEE